MSVAHSILTVVITAVSMANFYAWGKYGETHNAFAAGFGAGVGLVMISVGS